AIKASSTMATAFGIDVPRVKVKVFVISAAMAALGGALYAYYMRFLSPTSFDIAASFNLLIIVILGGIAHPVGAVTGAVAFAAIELASQHVFANVLGMPGQLEMMVFGVILIVTLLR